MKRSSSALPLTESERPQRKSVPEAMDALERARRLRLAAFYLRPIPDHAKALMHRIMGEPLAETE